VHDHEDENHSINSKMLEQNPIIKLPPEIYIPREHPPFYELKPLINTTNAAQKIADIVAKKGDFGNADRRDEIGKMLQDAMSAGLTDELLTKLNVELKKKNPDLTLSWHTTTTDNNLTTDEKTVVQLVNAKTGEIEDRVQASNSSNKFMGIHSMSKAIDPWLKQTEDPNIIYRKNALPNLELKD
jgi:hypothetical protein